MVQGLAAACFVRAAIRPGTTKKVTFVPSLLLVDAGERTTIELAEEIDEFAHHYPGGHILGP